LQRKVPAAASLAIADANLAKHEGAQLTT